ncbi:hypothetical protein R50076_19390 [Gilvimarinus japonicus]
MSKPKSFGYNSGLGVAESNGFMYKRVSMMGTVTHGLLGLMSKLKP